MDDSCIILAHGGGGSMTRELVEGLIVPALGQPGTTLSDAAAIPGAPGLMYTTDAFVVKPLFFRGGDIGSLSVHGTVNDLAVSGAEPLALSWAMIIEEGLEMETVRRVAESAGRAARTCGVQIIAGDTKVVGRGEADKLYIVSSGIGRCAIALSPQTLRAGDAILINGPIGDHGIAVMSERQGIHFETSVRSDSASVWPLVRVLIDAGVELRVMRDPSRGGLAASCVELAQENGVSFALEETAIPVRSAVRAACEMLGLDPLHIANEGKLVACVSSADADKALALLRLMPGGEQAAVIGTVTEKRGAPVFMHTAFGGERIVDMPYGEELPRIC